MNKEKNEKLAEISARITQVITFLGETPNSFATKLGYPRAQTIYDIQKMKSAPSYDFFQRFSNAGFSVSIDLDWLLTGNGTMLKEKQIKEDSTVNTMDSSYIYNMYKDYKNLQAEKDIEVKELRDKIDGLQTENKTLNKELTELRLINMKQETYIEKLVKALEHYENIGTIQDSNEKKERYAEDVPFVESSSPMPPLSAHANVRIEKRQKQ